MKFNLLYNIIDFKGWECCYCLVLAKFLISYLVLYLCVSPCFLFSLYKPVFFPFLYSLGLFVTLGVSFLSLPRFFFGRRVCGASLNNIQNHRSCSRAHFITAFKLRYENIFKNITVNKKKKQYLLYYYKL